MRYNKKTAVLIIISIFVLLNLALIRSESQKISIKLDYKSYVQNDIPVGVEKDNNMIGFTVEPTVFNWNVDKSKLCTKWEIISMDSEEKTIICHGSDICCSFIELTPTKQNWDDILYLNYGRYGASLNNKISAQIIYFDYSLEPENPYSEVYHSDYDYLYAVFLDNNYFDDGDISDSQYPVIEKLEKIKAKNNLEKVSLTDNIGNPVLDNLNEKKLVLRLFISSNQGNKDEIYSYNSYTDESYTNRGYTTSDEVIAITNFDGINVDWDRFEDISIEMENPQLEEHIKSKGLIVRKSVTINNVREILEEKDYEGYVKLYTGGIAYDGVLYCSDNLECNRLKKCTTINENCYSKWENSVEIYIPHFSSISLILDESSINLTIKYPENNSVLESGEEIYLNFTTDITISANYSLDGRDFVYLGSSSLFSSKLEGSLDYGILENGLHTISINLMDSNSDIAKYNYSFSVNDDNAPKINITHNSVEINNSLITGIDNAKEFYVQSDEYSKVSYKLNSNQYSTALDLTAANVLQIGMDLQEGENNLLLNTTDMHGNSRTYGFTFNFSYIISCSDGIQNGDETGIDCGGVCDSCIEFDVTTSKTAYDLGEEVLATVLSRADSIVNLSILFEGNVVDNEIITGYSPDYPIYVTTALNNINSPGEYTIEAVSKYMDYSETNTIYFSVNSPSDILRVNINANPTTINEGDTIKFTGTTSGKSGSLTYKWDFGNDGSIDSYSSEVTRAYSSNGTYTVNLTVTDNINTASDIKTITVRKVFNVTIIVKNNSKNPIINADVEFDDVEKSSSDEGKVSFLVNKDTYKLKIRKEGYESYSNNSIVINRNITIEVNLPIGNDDYQEPIITILSPNENQSINDNTVRIVYRVEDDLEVDCALHINEYQNWWVENANMSNAPRNTENTFTLYNLTGGNHRYRIKCNDKDGNTGISRTKSFYINLYINDEIAEQEVNIDHLINNIDELLPEFEKLPEAEKDVFETLKIRETLDKAKIKLQRYKRDLNNLIWRRLNKTELNEIERNIYENIQNMKDEIPVSINVIDSKEFVAYPKNEDVEDITLKYLNSTNNKYSRKEKKNIIENTKGLQSLITITSNVKIIELEYLNGEKKIITLVKKELKIGEQSRELSLIEYIPKELAKDIKDVEFLFDYEVIEEYPLIKINLDGVDNFAYYFKKETNPDDIKKTKSILIEEYPLESFKETGFGAITGFAVMDNIKETFSGSSNTRIIIEIMIIATLILVYLGYSIKGTKIKYYFTDRGSLKNLDKINNSISIAESELQNNHYEKAKSSYKEAGIIFKGLPKEMKKEAYNNIVILSNKLDKFHINGLVKKAIFSIEQNNKKTAASIYGEIRSIYKKIHPEYKSEVLKKCNELNLMLSKKNA